MDAHYQSNDLIRALRPGDLVGHRDQPTHQVYEVMKVETNRLLAARPPKPTLRFLAFYDIAPPF